MSTEVYMNGKIIGSSDDAKSFIDQFKEDRRKGKVAKDINLQFKEQENEIHIFTSRGIVTK